MFQSLMIQVIYIHKEYLTIHGLHISYCQNQFIFINLSLLSYLTDIYSMGAGSLLYTPYLWSQCVHSWTCILGQCV